MGYHPEFGNKAVMGLETTLVDRTRLVPGNHANYSSGPMAGRGPRNKLVTEVGERREGVGDAHGATEPRRAGRPSWRRAKKSVHRLRNRRVYLHQSRRKLCGHG